MMENALNMPVDPFSSGHFVSAIGHIYFLTDEGVIEYDYNKDKAHLQQV